jgi:hypothetical protein
MGSKCLELPYALGEGRLKRRREAYLFWVLLAVAALIALHLSAAAQTSRETRRVLILNDLGIISSPGFAEIDQALVAGLQKSPYHIELYQESLEVTLFPDEGFRRRLLPLGPIPSNFLASCMRASFAKRQLCFARF